MRYISEENIILVSLSEFVGIARRKISSAVPADECEPILKSSRADGGSHGEKLEMEFREGGNRFRISSVADEVVGNSLTVIRYVKGSPSQKKNEIAQCRGEAFVLGKILAEKYDYDSVRLTVSYIYESSGEGEDVSETADKAALDAFFKKCVSAISVYARPEIERVTERLPSLNAIRFPYGEVREGQDEFIRRVYRTLSRGDTLFACAPTGTGKTVSVIYPALKALGDGKCDKVFYLTPKTTTAEAARDCLSLFEKNGAKVRSIILTSKEKSCPRRLICRDSLSLCDMAKCNKLAEATLAVYALEKTVITLADITEIATRYAVCPYEIELSYSELCDVVIGDFNYLFDPVVYIRRFFTEGGRFAFLIDEAHNLCDRGREMYSADISFKDIDELLFNEKIGALSRIRDELPKFKNAVGDVLMPYLKDEMRKDENGRDVGATHLSHIPDGLYFAVSDILGALEDEEQANLRSRDTEKNDRLKLIRTLLYKIKKLDSAMSSFDSRYRVFVFLSGGNLSFKIFCIDTSKEIQNRIEKGCGAVFFSATLSPLDYYKSALSTDKYADTLEVRSPFDPEQLSVSIIDKISTRYSERERTLPAVARTIAATLAAKRGHYMVFAPSFEYAESIYREFSSRYPKIKCLLQGRSMSDEEKSKFLTEFSHGGDEYLLGFCVMGGIYSEGIDLAGESLIGAVVVGIGMPSLSYEREAIAEYFQDKYDSGKEYAYIYPGMNRVFQAAGRVIRRESDRGVIVLIDDRFADPIYKKSIPSLWSGMQYIANAKDLKAELDKFWSDKQ